MTHTYQITGMTCPNCEAKVKSALLALPDITSVNVSRVTNSAIITMDRHISLVELQNAISPENKYRISAINHSEAAEQTKSWLSTYKPILIIFGYIFLLSILLSYNNGSINSMQFMNVFMACFFLTFSFFKMLDLKGFAESYSMYDVVAKKFKAWGYVYAFIELALGIAYAINYDYYITNLVTIIVMSIGLIGVIQSVLAKQKIQCACLGTVFNLPMSTVTITEDALMITMSFISLSLI